MLDDPIPQEHITKALEYFEFMSGWLGARLIELSKRETLKAKIIAAMDLLDEVGEELE